MIYEEALAFYNGNLDQLRRAREEALAKARREAEEIRLARIQRAEQTGSKAEVEKIKQEKVATPLADLPPTTPISANASEAQEIMDKAVELYNEAEKMKPVPDRDRKYKKAGDYFTQARDMFYALGMEAEGVKANRMRYGCIQKRRF